MKTSPITFFSFAVAMFLVCGATDLRAQGTAFTYQGRLTDNGSPANGSYDLRFYLRDALNAGNPVGTTNTIAPVAVSNGLFTVALDFGAGIFTGPARWLEIGVRTNGSGAAYSILGPRQALTPSPYAIFASTSSNVANGSVVKSLNTLKDDVALAAGANVTITPSGNTLTIASTGGSGPWLLNGSSAYYNGGKVGVGTTTPAAALEVNDPNGNALIYATAPRPNLILRDTIAGNARSVIGGFDGGLRFYTESWESGANSSAFMAFTTNGNLGIGTSTPLSALHISGNADAVRLTGSHPFLTLDDTAAGLYSRIQADGAGMNFKTQGAVTGSNPSGLLHLDGVGNVGIGTTTPLTRLTVAGAGAYNDPAAAAITLDNTTAGRRWEWQALDDGKMQLADFTLAASRLVIDTAGKVGIGTTTPNHKLSVAGSPTWTANGWGGAVELENASAIAWRANAAGQRFGMGHSGGGFYLFRTASDPGNTGSAATYDFAVDDSGNVGIGTSAPLAKLHVVGTTRTCILTITGGCDLAEPFPTDTELPKGSVVVIDEEHTGQLKCSHQAYDTRVAGIISGANGISPGISLQQEGVFEKGQNVALTGRVYAQADATYGAIKPGDLLTTSNTQGHAMKVIDHAKAQGAILGKAMSSLKDGKGLVLVLVTLQ